MYFSKTLFLLKTFVYHCPFINVFFDNLYGIQTRILVISICVLCRYIIININIQILSVKVNVFNRIRRVDLCLQGNMTDGVQKGIFQMKKFQRLNNTV